MSLILTEGGVLLFVYPFADEWEQDSELFGSFCQHLNHTANFSILNLLNHKIKEKILGKKKDNKKNK